MVFSRGEPAGYHRLFRRSQINNGSTIKRISNVLYFLSWQPWLGLRWWWGEVSLESSLQRAGKSLVHSPERSSELEFLAVFLSRQACGGEMSGRWGGGERS